MASHTSQKCGGWTHTWSDPGSVGEGVKEDPLCFWSFPGAENTEGKDKNLTEPTPLPAEDRAKVCWKAVLSRREVHVVQVSDVAQM